MDIYTDGHGLVYCAEHRREGETLQLHSAACPPSHLHLRQPYDAYCRLTLLPHPTPPAAAGPSLPRLLQHPHCASARPAPHFSLDPSLCLSLPHLLRLLCRAVPVLPPTAVPPSLPPSAPPVCHTCCASPTIPPIPIQSPALHLPPPSRTVCHTCCADHRLTNMAHKHPSADWMELNDKMDALQEVEHRAMLAQVRIWLCECLGAWAAGEMGCMFGRAAASGWWCCVAPMCTMWRTLDSCPLHIRRPHTTYGPLQWRAEGHTEPLVLGGPHSQRLWDAVAAPPPGGQRTCALPECGVAGDRLQNCSRCRAAYYWCVWLPESVLGFAAFCVLRFALKCLEGYFPCGVGRRAAGVPPLQDRMRLMRGCERLLLLSLLVM